MPKFRQTCCAVAAIQCICTERFRYDCVDVCRTPVDVSVRTRIFMRIKRMPMYKSSTLCQARGGGNERSSGPNAKHIPLLSCIKLTSYQSFPYTRFSTRRRNLCEYIPFVSSVSCVMCSPCSPPPPPSPIADVYVLSGFFVAHIGGE